MKAIIFFIFFIFLALPPVFGQIKIGDNPQNIDASSVLELESSSKVLVITRVNTLEMEAITPQRGGLVYNTDTECVNYYDGTQWVNLCDAVNFTITNDPIINGRSTIEITESAAGYNLEVAKNSILGDNIIDGGIGPDDIQDNSITQDKLAAESVGSSELRQNAVGSVEIRDGSIAPEDMANTIADQVLTTDENGIVQWEDTNDLFDLTFDKLDNTLTISRSTTPGVSTISLEALVGSDDQQLDLTGNILSIENDPNTVDLSTYLQQISINNRRITLTNGGFIDLPAGTVNTDNQTLSLTGNTLAISGGNNVNLNKYLDNTDEQQLSIAGNRISLTDGGFVDLPPGTVDTDEQQLSIVGNRISLTDGGFVDIPEGNLSLDDGFIFVGNAASEPTPVAVGGDVTMNNIGQFSIENNTIESDNIVNNSITLEDLNQNGAADGQVIKWDETLNAGMGAWTVANDIANGTGANITDTDANDGLSDYSNTLGYDIIVDDATIEIVGDALQVKEDAIGLDQLNPMGATTNGQVLKWNQDNTQWELGTDANGSAVVDGDNDDALTDFNATTGYNINVDDTTIEIVGDALQVKEDAIGLDQLNPMGATTNGQILKWNQDNTQWELGTDATGSAVIDGDNDDALTDFNATTGYNINVDDTTIEIVGDALQVKEDAIGLDQLNPMGATTNGQILKWNQDNTQWELGTDATGSAVIDGDNDDALTDFNATTGYNINVDDTTIEIVGDALQVKASATNNQVLQTIGGVANWQDLTNPANTGSILFSDGTGGIAENNGQLFWDNATLKLGVGTVDPDSKLDVNGQIRSTTIANGDGTENLPSYRFQDDLNSGMWLPAESELAFSTNSLERLRIIDDGNVGIGLTIPTAKLHVNGDIRAEGEIFAKAINIVPDYVFQKYFMGNSILNPSYEFNDLAEIEAFVKENKHLPGIQSAQAVKEQGFWNVSESSRVNLEKIEELFLHTIEQEKKIKELQKANTNMSSELEALKTQMEEIKTMLLEKQNN